MRDDDKIQPDDQKPNQNNPSKVDDATEVAPDSKVSRRRALIAGLAAAPVIITLMNRSAFGGTACTSQALMSSYNNTKQSGATAIASFTTRHKDVKYNTTTGELECS
jgi:hypothetical protein